MTTIRIYKNQKELQTYILQEKKNNESKTLLSSIIVLFLLPMLYQQQ